ncbi:sperm acrosome membrane-associated protein 6 isoform X1 [Manacus candei]|uniref:sperm acrosome membrane-associated protein 6 isoform X1 n=1 Tax=Manacus candei TaxID=415023 RepID=UPI00222808B8|nr:sperm acrosome membrane-associated protein 6 isoform X1 [Manacus candei]
MTSCLIWFPGDPGAQAPLWNPTVTQGTRHLGDRSGVMGWWWVALMLVLVPWRPRNAGLWLWVALVLCLPGVHSCLLCFGPPKMREQLCREITGASAKNPKNKKCQEDLVEAAKPLASVAVGAGQHDELRDIVLDALYYIEEQKNKKPLNKSLQEAVDTIWVKLSRMTKVPACVPPCGFQPDARVFQCATCHFADCEFPLDCPVQDLRTYTDETIVLLCDVPFSFPGSLPVTWMYVPNLRTQDMSLFKELKGNPKNPSSLTIEEPAPGTVACRLGEVSKPFVRKFFYLNVSEGSVEEERGLQAVFRAVLHWLHNEIPQAPIPTMGLALGVASMALVLLVVALWQCARWTSRRREQQGILEDSGSPDSPLGP